MNYHPQHTHPPIPTSTDTSTTSTANTNKKKDKSNRPKRKKTSRACIHCQRAHVTCDSGRPCQRCIKKKCEATCTDGIRKQAKYLQEQDVSIAASNSTSPSAATTADSKQNQPWPSAVPNLSASMQLPGYLPPTPPNPINVKIDEDYNTTNNNNTNTNTNNNHNNLHSHSSSATTTQPANTTTNNNNSSTAGFSPDSNFTSRAANLEYSILSNILDTGPTNSRLGSISETDILNTMSTPDSANSNTMPRFEDWMGNSSSNNNNNIPTEITTQSQIISSPTEQDSHPEEVYNKVTAPYPYTKGYHALIAYLRSRFDKKQLLHMAHAMAKYRPSFIATTKTLKEEDLIFMEKCFQRTLLEFEKFIAASGTPTVVWRRTGQIAAVGKEFCILTEWSKERLLNQQTFIVELMDDSSVTAYFDLFSQLAWGDSRGATSVSLTLLKPNGAKIRAACTWTIKRDVFDIPMMIIGNFLPILF